MIPEPSLEGLWGYLRRQGLDLGPDRLLAALAALRLDPPATDLESALPRLRAALAQDPRSHRMLPRWVREYLQGGAAEGKGPAAAAPAPWEGGTEGASLPAVGEGLLDAGEGDAPTPEGVPSALRASSRPQGGGAPRPAQAVSLEEAVRRLAWALRRPPDRRRRPMPRGDRLDLLATLRRSRTTLGEPLRPALRGRRRRPPQVVLLVDASGSMRGQEAFGLALASALVKGPLRAEVFAFHTALVPLTATLARLPRGEAPPLEDPGWAGGTRIGESLERYLEGPGRGLRRESHVMIWSDGWETGDPERLERALRRLIRRAGRVDWLDPLAHTPGYAPVTRGMQAARRVVRTFVPMADAEDLDRYARLLAKGG